jgi:hypothetical protein
VAEGFLHHDPAPAAVALVVGQARALHLLEHHGERFRRNGEVERSVADDSVRQAKVIERAAEQVERCVVVE